MENLNFDEMAQVYLEVKEGEELASISRIRLCVRHLVGWFGSRMLRDIRPMDVERYKSHRIAQPTRQSQRPSNATINRELATGRNLYNMAIANDYAEKNPFHFVKRLPEYNERNRIIRPEEFTEAIFYAPEPLRLMIIIAWFTGMRAGEIKALTWDMVDMEEGMIVFPAEFTKTRRARKIPIDAELARWLAIQPRLASCRYVVHHKGQPYATHQRAWTNLCKRLGWEDTHFHDLRHSFVQRLRKSGIHDHVIMSITGHRTRSMFQRYDAADEDDLRQAVS